MIENEVLYIKNAKVNQSLPLKAIPSFKTRDLIPIQELRFRLLPIFLIFSQSD